MGEVYESHAIKDKMMNLRSNKAIRDAKMDAAINKHYGKLAITQTNIHLV